MRVSIVVPAWNGRSYLPACLEALLTQAYPDFEVIVVDNASTDGSADLVAEKYPLARLIRNKRNLGFSGGCNAGMRAAQGEAIILLNQDTRVFPGWLAALVGTFQEKPSAGIVGGKGLYPDGRLQHAGGWVEWPLGFTHHYGYQESDHGQWETAREVEYVTGAAMGIRRALVERIGLLDEGFWPGYLEDADFCLRASRAGYEVWYCPQAIYLHYESTSTDTATRSRYYQRGRLRLVLKHLPPERILAEFVPAERATLPAVMAGPENRPTRLAYLEVMPDLPALLRQHWPVDDVMVADVLAALQQLHQQAWQADLQSLGEKASEMDLSPDYVRAVQARHADRSAEAGAWQGFKEYQFRSSIPLIGPLIMRLRWLWYNVAARWAVLYLMQQQEAINRAMSERLIELAEENMLLAARVAYLQNEKVKEST